ncbi:MAG: glycosyltransferase family 4 protein [Candidatus Buchananbacteria bacterium]
MNKSVAIAVCAWPPLGGGIGNNAYYQLKGLNKNSVTARAFTPAYFNLDRDVSSLVSYLPAVLPLGKAAFMRGLKRQLEHFDIIHLYWPFFGADLQVAACKRRHPEKKLVLHYQMDPVGRGVKAWIFRLYVKLFFGSLIKLADRILVLSLDHAQHSYLAPYLKLYPEKFLEWPNGVDTDLFKPLDQKNKLRALNKFSVQDKIAVFVGGLDKQHFFKGVPVLLQAFEKVVKTVPQAKLLIIGDGSERLKFEGQVLDLGLKDQVRFSGWVKNENLPAWYNLSDVFVLPSTESTESFGIVAAEAQACGLPAIVANWPGVRQTIKLNETGWWVEPKDINDLALKLAKLLADESLCQQFGQAGRERAGRLYSWTNLILRLLDIYNSLYVPMAEKK